jgi:hypothetical protein
MSENLGRLALWPMLAALLVTPGAAFADPEPAPPPLADMVASTLTDGCLQNSDAIGIATLFTRSGWPAFRNAKTPTTPADISFLVMSDRPVGGKDLTLTLADTAIHLDGRKVDWQQCSLADDGGRVADFVKGAVQALGRPQPTAGPVKVVRWTFKVNGKTRTPVVLPAAISASPRQIADYTRSFEPDERLIDAQAGLVGSTAFVLVSTYSASGH